MLEPVTPLVPQRVRRCSIGSAGATTDGRIPRLAFCPRSSGNNNTVRIRQDQTRLHNTGVLPMEAHLCDSAEDHLCGMGWCGGAAGGR
jgi:hypothetical protein